MGKVRRANQRSTKQSVRAPHPYKVPPGPTVHPASSGAFHTHPGNSTAPVGGPMGGPLGGGYAPAQVPRPARSMGDIGLHRVGVNGRGGYSPKPDMDPWGYIHMGYHHYLPHPAQHPPPHAMASQHPMYWSYKPYYPPEYPMHYVPGMENLDHQFMRMPKSRSNPKLVRNFSQQIVDEPHDYSTYQAEGAADRLIGYYSPPTDRMFDHSATRQLGMMPGRVSSPLSDMVQEQDTDQEQFDSERELPAVDNGKHNVKSEDLEIGEAKENRLIDQLDGEGHKSCGSSDEAKAAVKDGEDDSEPQPQNQSQYQSQSQSQGSENTDSITNESERKLRKVHQALNSNGGVGSIVDEVCRRHSHELWNRLADVLEVWLSERIEEIKEVILEL